MSDLVLTEISTALGEIVAHLDSKPQADVHAAMLEAATALGELVAAVEAQQSIDLTALVQAVQGLKLAAPTITVAAPKVSVAAPQVIVEVNPTPIHNHVPPAQISVHGPKERVTRIVVSENAYGGIADLQLIYTKI